MTMGRADDQLAQLVPIGQSCERHDKGKLLAGITRDELAASRAEVKPELARLRETEAAMDRSLTVPGRTTAELRQDVTRLGGRVDGLERRLDGIEVRLERIELRLGLAAT